MCRRTQAIELDRVRYERWYKQKELIQNVWPEKTPDERELLITGTHDTCWEQLFPDEEE